MTTEYRFTVYDPVSKNAMKRVALLPKKGGGFTARIVHTTQGKKFRKRIQDAARAVIDASEAPPIVSGTWHLSAAAYWPRQRHLGDVSVPHGDAGACTEEIRDALEKGGLVDNDARIVINTSTTHYDKENPRVEVTLRRID